MDTTPEIITDQIIEAVQAIVFPKGTTVEIVGVWVWVTFPERPPAEIRQRLVELGFIYNGKRQSWMHNCGKRSGGSKHNPRDTYGSKILKVKEE